MDELSLKALRAGLIPFLPQVEKWIDAYVARHTAEARTIASLGFARLPDYFSAETLRTAKVVRAAQIEKPPLSQMGLPGFDEFERMTVAGITYGNVFFISPALAADESLHFHELIHVLQWREAGVRNFIFAYAAGLAAFGYRDSPLEVMACDAQARFDAGEAIPDLEAFVTERTKAIIADPLTQP